MLYGLVGDYGMLYGLVGDYWMLYGLVGDYGMLHMLIGMGLLCCVQTIHYNTQCSEHLCVPL